jgi:hypothetical protein
MDRVYRYYSEDELVRRQGPGYRQHVPRAREWTEQQRFEAAREIAFPARAGNYATCQRPHCEALALPE